jgi:hypothetical protein
MNGYRHADSPQSTAIDPQLAEAQQRVTADLALIDWALPGSIVERRMRCGKQRCRCKNDPPELHGPYIQWTRTVNGKTVTKLLTPEQLSRYQRWLDNATRLRDLTTELETLTIQAIKSAEKWGS